MKTRMENVMLGAMAVVFLTASVGFADLTDGLVGYWSFDNSSDLGHDDSGTGNHGSPVGGASPTSGVMGGAVYLNGSGYISVPDSPSLDLPGGYGSISAFIRVNPSSGEFGIVAKESSASFLSTIAYEFTVRHSGATIYSVISDGSTGGYGYHTGANLKDSIWHHVATTWAPDEVRIYRDGVQVFQGNLLNPISTINNTSDPVLIGSFRWNSFGAYWNITGDMDEVRIYNRALSAAEIGKLINPNTPPIADAGGPYLVAVGQPIALDGSDSYDEDGDPLAYMWTQDDILGNFDDPSSENPNYTGSQAGITDLTLTVSDGQEDDSDTALIIVYDPSGGFVTGGGWIWSPAGAYADDPLLEGKATFGFVSKYKKGADVPTGNTEFQFQAGNLNFHSSSYDWLLVTGSDYARFKGTGTINGSGEYKFMLWAGDSNPDTFRIKIWTEDELGVEDIVYDNSMNQPIGGGSIVIHTK